MCALYFASPNCKPIELETLNTNRQIFQNPSLGTFNGVYFNHQSALVSKKEQLKVGAYVLIPSTYQTGIISNFKITIYHSVPGIEVIPLLV